MAEQRYTNPRALERMRDGACPECGHHPEDHAPRPFDEWWPGAQCHYCRCDLHREGVEARIAQYREDRAIKHVLRVGRKSRGKSPVFGRALYATTGACSCGGWDVKVNAAPSAGGRTAARESRRVVVKTVR